MKYDNQYDQKRAIQESKNNIKTAWYCLLCGNHNYTVAGKTLHIRTKKHKKKCCYMIT